ncbi:MAG: hypothetical protein FWG20_04380 [Candidatus Cloacimonetes bacterium]|nr:hypothetical protein [Candidatus Cloacimonadota bacterium]
MKNILTFGLVLLVLFGFVALYADITKPIAEGETDHAAIATEFDLQGVDVKEKDFAKADYSRRPEIFEKCYRTLYAEAVKKFPNENVDIRNINIAKKNYDSKLKKTNFTSNARVVILPEGTFSEAKALTRPWLEEEKEFGKGAVSADFGLTGEPLHAIDLPFNTRVWDQAYTVLLQNAQEQHGNTADIRDIKITVKDKESNKTTYGATAVVIVN